MEDEGWGEESKVLKNKTPPQKEIPFTRTKIQRRRRPTHAPTHSLTWQYYPLGSTFWWGVGISGFLEFPIVGTWGGSIENRGVDNRRVVVFIRLP